MGVCVGSFALGNAKFCVEIKQNILTNVIIYGIIFSIVSNNALIIGIEITIINTFPPCVAYAVMSDCGNNFN